MAFNGFWTAAAMRTVALQCVRFGYFIHFLLAYVDFIAGLLPAASLAVGLGVP